jgi:hypothetical protein
MRLTLQRVARALATSLLFGSALASPSDVKHAPTPAQLALMHELRACLNVDRLAAVPADVVLSCPKKNVEALVGVSRDDLFSSLGKPRGCSHPGSTQTWVDQACRDAVNVSYSFFPPCKEGPRAPKILEVLFTSAGVVSRSRWEPEDIYHAGFEGNIDCVP